ncbi:MFS transporter [Aeromicrobium fastidiosum]|uniref:MFS transporter n=1 Tax=Aeromicrobium fastidiosum TaxID=52699 RepID=A0A641AQF7_9ACTN|nr:MFS transporter [Aeromicrobium fastidiosum]KAA1380175.1 MFS transporter [Aeromicrobium fastidiosum]MBP2389714.1 sugar phosphate permease [Aeromicrobium fastidiosum]
MTSETRTPDKWLMLGVSMLGQVAGTIFVNGAPFLITFLRDDRGLSLREAGVIVAAPFVGITVSLVVWGLVVDRIGERASMTIGLAVVTAGAVGAAFSTSLTALALWFLLGGIGAGSTNSASGRVVVGWFPAHRRGTAMGIRQTALPLGVGSAALLIPNLVEADGLRTTLLVVGGITLAAAVSCATLIVDPPRPTRAQAADAGQLANPYRRDHRLARIHLASALLVVPQFTVWTYMLVWLIDDKGWSTFAASALVASTQVLGAGGRIAAGWWSDHVGSRLGPMRVVAIAAATTMLALGLLSGTPLGIALIVIATAITVADNGLAFTSVAEIGGPFWSGRAMGLQNTGQYVVSALVPPVVGALVEGRGYGFAFAAVAIFPLLAIPLVPVRGERRAA